MTKIFILQEKYKISKKIRLKQNKIEKIFIFQDQTTIKAFLSIFQSIHYLIFDYTKLTYLLIYFIRKIE